MIEVKNLTFQYKDAGEPSVRDISFSIPNGTIFGFLGPSGAGKSTTQNLMTGLLKIQQGSVTYNEVPIQRQKQGFYNSIGVSFEHPNVYGKLTGLENLKFFAGLFSVPTEDPLKVLDWVGLKDSAGKRASAYSKGMKQRLVFARALINRPSILFLDEPTGGLDPATAEVVKNIILRKREEGCTIFLTTHNMYSADELCDTVAFLNDGRLVAMDTPRSLKLSYGEASVAVEHRQDNGNVKKEILFPAKEDHARRLKELIDSGRIETLHSREATLEQIFIRLTGRSLA
jgi:fluoroquinolone transport system ATP-binding protein